LSADVLWLQAPPGFDWKMVVAQLDNPDFMVRDKKGLRLLMSGLTRGLQLANETLPVHHILKQWKNTEGQVNI
jgi:CCR4-NOT transcription complex subunit 1